MSRNWMRGLITLAAAQISVAVIGFRITCATAARCLPRFNHPVSSLLCDIFSVTTLGFIKLPVISTGFRHVVHMGKPSAVATGALIPNGSDVKNARETATAKSEQFPQQLFKPSSFRQFMPINEYAPPQVRPLTVVSEDASAPLDNLLHSKSRILRGKLEVLASEICTRLNMWDRNLARIDSDKSNVEKSLDQVVRLARYHLREQRDITRLEDSNLRLESQRRDEDVQCWRDVVMVMRDFLETWESHEQAKTRSIFFNHAGSRIEDSL